MDQNANSIPASLFKAKCLAILDDVAKTGLPVIVTKRGKPVAKLVSLTENERPDLLGSVQYEREEDLLAPVDESWNADQ